MMELNHKSLCALAVDWLKRPASRKGPGCLVAISESSNYINGEIPDAIGFRPFLHEKCGSILIEVKTSRADFFADFKKQHRTDPSKDMGNYRYFLMPEGLVCITELPPKWGLIEVNQRGHLKVRCGHVLLSRKDGDCWRFDSVKHDAEIATLVHCLNRVGDPQAVQDRLREANNLNARLQKSNERYVDANLALRSKIMSLQERDWIAKNE